MKVEKGLAEGFSGKIGDMVFYQRNGQTYARRAPTPKSSGKQKERSEKQKASTTRFQLLQRLYAYYKRSISADIWRVAAREKGRMAHNLFYSENYGCFDGKGQLVKPELLRFSAGSLLLPPGLRVERTGDGVFRATWEAEEEWETCAGTDRLLAGVVYPSLMPSMYRALESSGTRGELAGTFRVRTDLGPTAHVYLFFGREDGTAYSPSLHFLVEVAGAKDGTAEDASEAKTE